VPEPRGSGVDEWTAAITFDELLEHAVKAAERCGPRAAVVELEASQPGSADPESKQQIIDVMYRNGFVFSPQAHDDFGEPLFVPVRTKAQAAALLKASPVRHALQEVHDRLGQVPSEATGSVGMIVASARHQRRDELVDLAMGDLGYRWDETTRSWFQPWHRRASRWLIRAAVIVGAMLAVVGVFLVPTSEAAAARVAYLSAAVSVIAAAAPPLWRWAKGAR